jgi:PAS domain S-box-containing protein
MSTHQDTDREQRLFELVRDPLFVTSGDGRSLRVNAAGLELLGITEDEWRSRPYLELVHPDDRGAAAEALAAVLANGGTSTPSRIRVV